MFKSILILLAVSSLTFANDLMLQPKDFVLSKPLKKLNNESNDIYNAIIYNIVQYKLSYTQHLFCSVVTDNILDSKNCIKDLEKYINPRIEETVSKEEFNSKYANGNKEIITKNELLEIQNKYLVDKKSIQKYSLKIKDLIKKSNKEAEEQHSCTVDKIINDNDYNSLDTLSINKLFSSCL